MLKKVPKEMRAYLAGFLDGDGSIYVRAKPNASYRFGYQVAPSIILFQSAKEKEKFEHLCAHIGLGYIRERNDGILEYTINRIEAIQEFLALVSPYVILKKEQIDLMRRTLEHKKSADTAGKFKRLLELIDSFREINYSKKRKKRTLTL